MRLPDLLDRCPPTFSVDAVFCPDNAFRWASSALNRTLQKDELGKQMFDSNELRHLLTNRNPETSSAFSGIGSPGVADDSVSAAARDWLSETFDSIAAEEHVEHTLVHATEWYSNSQAKMMSSPGGQHPQHRFTDIRSFVLKNMRKPVGLDKGKELSPKRLKQLILEANMRVKP